APKPSPGLYIHTAGAGDAFTGMGTIMPPRRPRPPIKKLLAKKMAAKHAVKKMPPRRATPRPGPAPTPPQRFLNIAFWRDDPSGHLKEIRQKGATFHAGEVCQLAVYVGPQNLRIQVSDSAALELPPEKVKAAAFLSRLEYSTGSVHDVANRSAKAAGRTLSIVANDWD